MTTAHDQPTGRVLVNFTPPPKADAIYFGTVAFKRVTEDETPKRSEPKRPSRLNGPQFLDRSQIVERLHEAGLYDLDTEWVRSKMDQGHFPVTQIGPRGKRRVLASFIDDWIAKHAAQAAPSTPLRPHPAR